MTTDGPQGQRLETGPVRCGDDWAGVFVRGDDAAAYGHMLAAVLGRVPDDNFVANMERDLCRALVVLLRSCAEPCEAVRILRAPTPEAEPKYDDAVSRRTWLHCPTPTPPSAEKCYTATAIREMVERVRLEYHTTRGDCAQGFADETLDALLIQLEANDGD